MSRPSTKEPGQHRSGERSGKCLWRGGNGFYLVKQSLIALVSDHYSAAGTAVTYVGTVWEVRKILCTFTAATLAFIAYSRGLQNYDAGELDVLQSAFRKAGMEACALNCLDEALKRDLEYDHHTPALLLLGKANILADRHRGFEAERIIREKVLPRDISDIPQRTRVLKGAARILKKTGSKKEYEQLKTEALSLAEEHELGDQVAKIKNI